MDMMSMSEVLVVGDVMLDRYIMGSAARISPEAPVPVVLQEADRCVPGGAANVAVNAAALGAQVSVVGLVGRDDGARWLREALAAHNVLGDGLVADPGRPTTQKLRVLSGTQQMVRIDQEIASAPGPETAQHLIDTVRRKARRASVVVFSDYAKGVLKSGLAEAMIAAAREAGATVLVDPKSRDLSLYRGAHYITPNRKELHDATGLAVETDEDVIAAARIASGAFGGDLVVTRAERGMSLIRAGAEPFHVPANVRNIFDVTGAGDTAIATLAVALAARVPVEEAVVMANTAAGVSVGKVGTSIVSRAELKAALEVESPSATPHGACLDWNEAREVVARWRVRSERIVFTNGCYDLLHPGHVSLLESAAKHGDRLIVGINSDASVSRLKGPTRPVQREAFRAQVLGALRSVDLVVIFDEDTPLDLIKALQPDVLVKGADYAEHEVVGGQEVKSWGGRVVLVPIVAGHSTTNLVSRAMETS